MAASARNGELLIGEGKLFDCTLNGQAYFIVDPHQMATGQPYYMYSHSGSLITLCSGGDPYAIRKDKPVCVDYPVTEHGATCTEITSQCQF